MNDETAVSDEPLPEPQELEADAEALPVPSVEDGWTFFYCGDG